MKTDLFCKGNTYSAIEMKSTAHVSRDSAQWTKNEPVLVFDGL